jgi:hypothetical protein
MDFLVDGDRRYLPLKNGYFIHEEKSYLAFLDSSNIGYTSLMLSILRFVTVDARKLERRLYNSSTKINRESQLETVSLLSLLKSSQFCQTKAASSLFFCLLIDVPFKLFDLERSR